MSTLSTLPAAQRPEPMIASATSDDLRGARALLDENGPSATMLIAELGIELPA